MPKGKRGFTTPHVCVLITNPRRNIHSQCDQNARYRLQQSALDSFHTEIEGPVFLNVGPEAKLEMYNNGTKMDKISKKKLVKGTHSAHHTTIKCI